MKNDSYTYRGTFGPAYTKYLDQAESVRWLVEQHWVDSLNAEFTYLVIKRVLRMATQDK